MCKSSDCKMCRVREKYYEKNGRQPMAFEPERMETWPDLMAMCQVRDALGFYNMAETERFLEEYRIPAFQISLTNVVKKARIIEFLNSKLDGERPEKVKKEVVKRERAWSEEDRCHDVRRTADPFGGPL